MRCIRPNNHSAALSVLFGGTIVLSSSTTDSWHRLSWKLEFLGGARSVTETVTSLLSPLPFRCFSVLPLSTSFPFHPFRTVSCREAE